MRITDCQKSLAEFTAYAVNNVSNIFDRGVYVDENTSQAPCLEFVCHKQPNYVRSRLKKLKETPEGVFRQVQIGTGEAPVPILCRWHYR